MEPGGSYFRVELAAGQSAYPTKDLQSQCFAAYRVKIREVDELVVN